MKTCHNCYHNPVCSHWEDCTETIGDHIEHPSFDLNNKIAIELAEDCNEYVETGRVILRDED